VSVIGECDWKGWAPMKPLADHHRSAKCGQLYWEILGNYVNEFFEANKRGIRDHWDEIAAMSKDLVENSVNFVALPNEYQPPPTVEGDGKWVFANRPEDGCPRSRGRSDPAVSLINDIPDDLIFRDLKSLCHYVLYQLTWSHSWIHAEMKKDTCSIKHHGLPPRETKEGEGCTPPSTSIVLLGAVTAIDQFQYSFLTKDPRAPQRQKQLFTGAWYTVSTSGVSRSGYAWECS